jgi:HSP20 family protein
METHAILTRDKDERFLPPHRVSSFFDNVLSVRHPLFSLSERIWNPPTDVYETSDSIIVKMEIAGVERDELIVTANKNQLIIRGKRVEDTSVNKENYHIMEIHYGHFQRIFAFPDDFELANIAATYENGFLRIVIPKGYKPKREIKIDIEEK